jgi:uncharacterized protein (DUF4415 family)
MTQSRERKSDLLRRLKEVDRIMDELTAIDEMPRLRRPIPSLWEDVWRAYPTHPPRRPLTLRLDEDVIAFFKAQGRGYQTRMNAVLRAYMLAWQGGALER